MAQAVLLKSLGCRTNQEEMIALSSRLAKSGRTIVDSIEDADVVIVNSCFVTAIAEAKTRRMISAITRLRPGVKICMTGCLAQYSPLDVKKNLRVTWVVGNSFKQDIPAILDDASGGVFHDDFHVNKKSALALSSPVLSPSKSKRTRYYLKIQEGCDFSCAYCIVPTVRGPSRSAAFLEIKSVFQAAVAAGYKEIVITGTHIGQYCDKDIDSLHLLVKQCVELDGDFRLRLSSLDPKDMTDPFLELIATHPKICRHCHVSVQSLCPTVLSAMNRPSSEIDQFVERLAAFHRAYPHVGIGGDFIVGFPGETSDMFAETASRVTAVGFGYGHVFRYSPRPQTKAAGLAGQIDEDEKIRRSGALRAVLDECHDAFVSSARRYVQTIIVESESPASGLASNYLRIDAPGTTAPKNTWLNVSITGTDPQTGRCIAVPQGN